MKIREVFEKVKENIFLRLFFGLFVIMGILLLCCLVHEFSHLLAGEFLGLHTFGIQISNDGLFFEAKVLYDEYLMKKRIFLVSGSSGGILFASLLIKIGKEKISLSITLAAFIYISCEFLYWLFSPVFQAGDFYLLLQTYLKPTLYVWYVILIIFFIMIIIFAGYRIRDIYYLKIIEEIKKKYRKKSRTDILREDIDDLRLTEQRKFKLLN